MTTFQRKDWPSPGPEVSADIHGTVLARPSVKLLLLLDSLNWCSQVVVEVGVVVSLVEETELSQVEENRS